MVVQETSLEADVLERGCTFLDESFHRGLDACSGQRGRREGMDWILFGLDMPLPGYGAKLMGIYDPRNSV